MTNKTPLLDIDIAEKRYGERRVLHDLHLQLAPGEIVSLIGPSGCGKSSLLSTVAGLDRAFRGTIRLDGVTLQGVSRDIGVIFQEPRLFPWLTVAQNIAFDDDLPLRSKTLPPQVAALLDEVGLTGYADALPKQLSGGQAQRVAIARGLYTQPRLLLLDEPFSAVDAFTRMKLQDLLTRIAYQHALTVLLVTHDIDEALYLSDRIILLEGGAAPAGNDFTVGLPRPRQRSSPALAPLKSAILDKLHAAHAF